MTDSGVRAHPSDRAATPSEPSPETVSGIAGIPCAAACSAVHAAPNPCENLQWPQPHGIGFLDDGADEIFSSRDYADLKLAAKCYPYLRAPIARAAADGKVTQGEERDIEQLYFDRMDAEREHGRRAAAEELRRATR